MVYKPLKSQTKFQNYSNSILVIELACKDNTRMV